LLGTIDMLDTADREGVRFSIHRHVREALRVTDPLAGDQVLALQFN